MKKKFALASLFGACLILQPITFLAGCSKTSASKKIITPVIKSISYEFDDDEQIANLIFYGFEYSSDLNIDKVEVSSTFTFQSKSLPISIIDINKEVRTFNVKVSFPSPTKATILGKIKFTINGESIDSSTDDYTIELAHKKYVTLPTADKRTAANRQISEGKATATFKGFTVAGDVVVDSIICSFVPSYPVSTECKIKLNLDNTFQVDMTIAGCTQDRPISGYFEFRYAGKELKISKDDQKISPFNISFLDEKKVYPCETKTVNGFYQDDTNDNSVIFTKFSYVGYTQQELEALTPTASFVDVGTGATKTFDATIENIDTEQKTFDIKITFVKDDIGEYTGSIKVGDTTIPDFSINLYYSVPENDLDIKQESSSPYRYYLNGFNPSLSETSEYNALLVPAKVGYISANAFKDKITSEAFVNIKHLFFAESGQLLYIGESAFEGCTGLIGNLNLPDTLRDLDNDHHAIGKKAFYGCSGLDKTLTIPFNTETIKLCEQSFSNCNFSKLDMSQYPNNILPDWMLNSKKMFENWSAFSPEWVGDPGVVVVNSQVYASESWKNEIKAKLTTFGLGSNLIFEESK